MASFAAVAKSAVAARRGLKVSIDTSPPHRTSGAPSPGSQRSKAVRRLGDDDRRRHTAGDERGGVAAEARRRRARAVVVGRVGVDAGAANAPGEGRAMAKVGLGVPTENV